MERISRRLLLIQIGAAIAGGCSPGKSLMARSSDYIYSSLIQTEQSIDQEEELLPESELVENAQELDLSPTQLQEKWLGEHLEITAMERERIRSLILDLPGRLDEPSNLFVPIRNLTKEQILEDWEMYSPIYLAASQEFSVPPLLLWVIHVGETTVSRSPDPGASNHIGAMQRYPGHRLRKAFDPFSGEEEFEVTGNWWFLKELPQRWFSQSPTHSFDYVEIFWAAEFIRRKYHEFYPRMTKEAGMLAVVENNYSRIGGPARVLKYRQLKQLFQIVP